MKKPYLLLMWNDYYPDGSTENWKGFYKTKEDALNDVIMNGTGIIPNSYSYPDGNRYDNYEVVNVEEYSNNF